jgi:hypothetical protein
MFNPVAVLHARGWIEDEVSESCDFGVDNLPRRRFAEGYDGNPYRLCPCCCYVACARTRCTRDLIHFYLSKGPESRREARSCCIISCSIYISILMYHCKCQTSDAQDWRQFLPSQVRTMSSKQRIWLASSHRRASAKVKSITRLWKRLARWWSPLLVIKNACLLFGLPRGDYLRT